PGALDDPPCVRPTGIRFDCGYTHGLPALRVAPALPRFGKASTFYTKASSFIRFLKTPRASEQPAPATANRHGRGAVSPRYRLSPTRGSLRAGRRPSGGDTQAGSAAAA